MSKLGYFMGGAVAGIAGITVAALLHDKLSSSGGAGLSGSCSGAETGEEVHSGEEAVPDMAAHSAQEEAESADRWSADNAHQGATA